MPRFTTLPDWLAWQENLHPKKIDLGLERVARVAARLNLQDMQPVVVSIAGTNGKGSSVAMLESILLQAGYRVGCYTSPHLLHYNERVRINAAAIDDASLCDAFETVDAQRGETSLSYFEFGTLAALWLFSRSPLDVVLLEVGLGGRLDAVNVMDADVALVTAVDIDHREWLGDDRESIGREKAGIFRAGRPAVCSDPAAPESLRSVADGIGAEWYCLGEQFDYATQADLWQWRGPHSRMEALPQPLLRGRHQLDNAAGVLMVLECLQRRLPVGATAIRAGLASVALPGRCQVIPGAVELVLDVSHNPHGAAALADMLAKRPCRGDTHLVIGMLQDKDVGGTIAALAPVADQWYFAGLGTGRGLSAEQLQAHAVQRQSGATGGCFADVADALQQAFDNAVEGDRVVVCGSFHTVAAAMACRV
jgi:dihydrofolate synthase/folylpolyglutamate synthase